LAGAAARSGVEVVDGGVVGQRRDDAQFERRFRDASGDLVWAQQIADPNSRRQAGVACPEQLDP
jgi:hypothetical protein